MTTLPEMTPTMGRLSRCMEGKGNPAPILAELDRNQLIMLLMQAMGRAAALELKLKALEEGAKP